MRRTRYTAAGRFGNAYCKGVIALTNSDAVNLKIAIAAELLRPRLATLCRADTQDIARNMQSFGTDHIINAFELFAGRLAMALHSPGMYLLFRMDDGGAA